MYCAMIGLPIFGLILITVAVIFGKKSLLGAFLFSAIFVVSGAGFAVYHFLLRPKVEVHAFGMGLVALVNDKERIIPYSSITKVTIREHVEQRGAPLQLVVTLKSNSAGRLEFNSLFEGNPQAVIQTLASSVENVNYIEWRGG